MSVKTIRPSGNLGSAQSGQDWSRGVWADCPLTAIREGELAGEIFEFDFNAMPITPATTEGNFGLFAQFSDTGGTVDPGTTGGWAFGSDGDNEGASIRSRTCPFKIIRTGKKLWFEASVKKSTIADTKHGVLFGLIENAAFSATVPITAAGAIADKNMVGFRIDEADGDNIDTVYKADTVTAVTVQGDCQTLVADTFYKFGFVFDPGIDSSIHDPNRTGAGAGILKYFVDGIPLATSKQIPTAAGTDFPNDVYMGFFFAVLNATATTPGTSTIRRVRIAQLF